MEIKRLNLAELDDWIEATRVEFSNEALSPLNMKIVDAEKGVIECMRCGNQKEGCHPAPGWERDALWWLCLSLCNDDQTGNESLFEQVDADCERAKRIEEDGIVLTRVE